jgi:FkbM family methyltransferase
MAIASEFLIENIYDFSKLKFIPKHIIDCGGYKGYFTWSALKKFKKSNFICFEPHPENYNSIKDIVIENDLSNVEIINKALSTSCESLKLCINGTMAGLYSTNGKIIDIEAIDLNKIVENKCDLLLKVDIEGAELEFFPAIIYNLPQKCAVYLETHDSWNSLHSVKKVFLENGFEFQVIRERGLYIDSFAQRI